MERSRSGQPSSQFAADQAVPLHDRDALDQQLPAVSMALLEDTFDKPRPPGNQTESIRFNQWQLSDDGSEMRLEAQQVVAPEEFQRTNPDVEIETLQTNTPGFKLQHPATGEIDNGWIFDGRTPEGKVRLRHSYDVKLPARGAGTNELVQRLDGVGQETVDGIENKLQQMPQYVLDELTRHGFKILICPTIADAVPALKDLIPRGWKIFGDNLTFDHSDGTQDPVRRLIIMPENCIYDKEMERTDRPNVVTHEVAHILNALHHFTTSEQFLTAYKQGIARLDPQDKRTKYLKQPGGAGEDEAFASLCGMLLTGPENEEDRALLESNFPEAILAVKQFLISLQRKQANVGSGPK